MSMDISISFDGKEAKKTSPSSYYIWEISSITPIQGGRYAIQYKKGMPRLTHDLWMKLVNSNGDLRSIGVEPNTDPLPYFSESTGL